MKLVPPMLLRIRIASEAQRWPALWLPVFLVWPLVLLLAVLLAMLAVPAWLGLQLYARTALEDRASGPTLSAVFRVLGASYALLCETRGTLIDVEGGPAVVLIAVY